MSVIAPLDLAALRTQFVEAQPFPFVVIENFLEADVAAAASKAYPSYFDAQRIGREFSAVNEKRKVQVTDYDAFPEAVKKIADAISGPEFLRAVEHITGIPRLLADSEYAGGGMHLTRTSGRLDVHVDFNYIPERQLHRRLNILIYLNPEWQNEWGGFLELWDRDVKRCHHAFRPQFNRCVIFETSDISYHGVTPVACPEGHVRQSFAAYYYTKEAPAGWTGESHSTLFKARPDEKVRASILMPFERLQRKLSSQIIRSKRLLKDVLGR